MLATEKNVGIGGKGLIFIFWRGRQKPIETSSPEQTGEDRATPTILLGKNLSEREREGYCAEEGYRRGGKESLSRNPPKEKAPATLEEKEKRSPLKGPPSQKKVGNVENRKAGGAVPSLQGSIDDESALSITPVPRGREIGGEKISSSILEVKQAGIGLSVAGVAPSRP